MTHDAEKSGLCRLAGTDGGIWNYKTKGQFAEREERKPSLHFESDIVVNRYIDIVPSINS